jgi:hypothetical protein
VGPGECVPGQGVGGVDDVVVLLGEAGVERREDLLLQPAVAVGVGVPCPLREGVAVGDALARRLQQSEGLAEIARLERQRG